MGNRTRSLTRRRFLQETGGLAALGAAGTWLPMSSGLLRAADLPKPGEADWPRFGYDLHNTRFNAKEKILGPNNVERLKVKWQFDTDDNFVIQQTPTVIGDTLFFGSGRYEYAVDSATGKLKWKFEWASRGEWEKTSWQQALKNRGTRSSPHYENGRIYFGSGSTTVYCVDAASGNEVWRRSLTTDQLMEPQSFYSPVVYNGKVFMAYSGGDAAIFCLDAETGAIRWKFRVAQDIPLEWKTGGGSVWTSGAIDEKHNIIYNATGSNKAFAPNLNLYTTSIVAHDIDTGELLWYYQAHPQDAFDLDFCAHPMVLDAVSPARFRDDIRPCVVAGNKAGIYCLNRHTGQLYWHVMLGAACSSCGPLIDAIATADNKVFAQYASPVSTPPMAVTAALNAYNGNIEWIVPNPEMNSAPIAVANGVLYQGLNNGMVEALDAKNGRRLWGYKMPSSYRGGVAIANGAIYTSNGEPTSWAGEQLPYKHSLYCFTVDGK